MQSLYRTADGGHSWTGLPVTSPVAAAFNVGLPLSKAPSSTVVFPLETAGSEGGTFETQLYVMQLPPNGASSQSLGSPVTILGTPGHIVFITTNGDIVAFTSRGRASYRSTNGGRSWLAPVEGPGLRTGWHLSQMIPSGSQSAIGIASESTCASIVTGRGADCTRQSALFRVDIATMSWTKISS